MPVSDSFQRPLQTMSDPKMPLGEGETRPMGCEQDERSSKTSRIEKYLSFCSRKKNSQVPVPNSKNVKAPYFCAPPLFFKEILHPQLVRHSHLVISFCVRNYIFLFLRAHFTYCFSHSFTHGDLCSTRFFCKILLRLNSFCIGFSVKIQHWSIRDHQFNIDSSTTISF